MAFPVLRGVRNEDSPPTVRNGEIPPPQKKKKKRKEKKKEEEKK